MIAILSMLIVISVSMLIVRIGAAALVLTGLSEPIARFQARSAFSGTGFTTQEAELVMTHPVRRRVISTMLTLGSIGIVSALATALLSMLELRQDAPANQIATLVGGLSILLIASRSRHFDRTVGRLLQRILRRMTDFELRDYAALLELDNGYTIAELTVNEDSWLAHQTIEELKFPSEGIVLLSLQRATGEKVPLPAPSERLNPGDEIVVYGRSELVESVPSRPAGPEGANAHREACIQNELERRDRTEHEAV